MSSAQRWNQLSRMFNEMHCDLEFELNAFVLMSNHFHGVVRIARSKTENWNSLLESRCRLTLEDQVYLIRIEHIKSLRETLLYIYKNPVEAGIAESALEFRYSTYRQIISPNSNLDLVKIERLNDPLHLILRPILNK